MADSDGEGEQPTPFLGISTFKYNSPHAGDLSFPKKATVHVLREEDEDWYYGEYDGKQGIFPKNFVSFLEPLQAEHQTASTSAAAAAVVEPPKATAPISEHITQEHVEEPMATSVPDEPVEIEHVNEEAEDEIAEPQDEPEILQPDEPASAAQIPEPEPEPVPLPVPVSVAAPIPTATKPPPPARAAVAPPPVRSSTASSTDGDTVVEPSAQSFRDRLAAFNKAAAPPPIPKPLPKPSNLVRRPYMDKPAVPPPKPAAPLSADTATPPATPASSNVPEVVEPSKEAEVPRRSVGSLRDRITALQSVPMPGMPGVPGRPPPRLPKKTPTSEEEMDDGSSAADDVATPSSEVASPIVEKEPTPSTPSAGIPDNDDVAAPANVDDSEEAEEQPEPTEEEKELQRRQALAQRMAALGGARIGLAPLPKRAAPPKRRPPPAEPKAEETEQSISPLSSSTADETTALSDKLTSPIAQRPTSIVSTEEADIPPVVPTRRPTSELESPAMSPVADETDVPPTIPKARPASVVGAKRAVPPVPSRSDTVSPETEEPEDIPPPLPSNRPSSRPSSQYGGRPPIPAGVAPPSRRGSGKVASAPIPPKRGSTSGSRPTSMVSNDTEGAPQIPARPTSVVVDSEDEDVPPPIPASRPVPAPPAEDIMEDDEEEEEQVEEPAAARQATSPVKREAVTPPATSPPPLPKSPPPLPKSPPPVAPIAVATGAAAAGAAVATAATTSPIAKDSPTSPQVVKSPVVDVPAPPPVAPGQTPQLAQDIDLDQASGWWLSDPVQLPSSLRGRQDLHHEVDGSSKMKKGKWIVTLDLHVLFADLSQSIITVSYAQGDTSPSAATLSQRHNPPPPPPSPAELQRWSSTLGSGVLGFAFQQTGHAVGDGSSAALIKEAIRTVRSALRPIGNASFGHLLYEAQEGHANQNEENDIRPGDIAVLSKAKFHGRRGIASYTHFAGFDSRGPQVSIVTEFDKSKRKIRVLEQRDSTDENGSSGRHGVVESNSYKVTDVKSGSVRVYRLMDASTIPEWIEEDD